MRATSWPSYWVQATRSASRYCRELYEPVLTNLGNGVLVLRGFEQEERP